MILCMQFHPYDGGRLETGKNKLKPFCMGACIGLTRSHQTNTNYYHDAMQLSNHLWQCSK